MADLSLNQLQNNLIYLHFSFLGLTTTLSLSKSIASSRTEESSQDLTSQVDATQLISSQLAGQWQFQRYFSLPMSVVLTDQGKGYILTTPLTIFNLNIRSRPTAYEFDYQIIDNNEPLQIDIIQLGEQPIKTIFEFINDDLLRIELMGLIPQETRPTEFSAGSLLLERVSRLTALPRNAEIVNFLDEKIRVEEKTRKNVIGIILRAEQAYFLENDTFTTNFSELGVELAYCKSPNYDLQIVTSDHLQQELIVATIVNLQQELYKTFNISLRELGVRLTLIYYQLLSHKLQTLISDNLQEELSATVKDILWPELIVTATAKISGLKSFIGVVFIVDFQGMNFSVVQTCETIEPSRTPPDKPILNGRTIECAIGSCVPEN